MDDLNFSEDRSKSLTKLENVENFEFEIEDTNQSGESPEYKTELARIEESSSNKNSTVQKTKGGQIAQSEDLHQETLEESTIPETVSVSTKILESLQGVPNLNLLKYFQKDATRKTLEKVSSDCQIGSMSSVDETCMKTIEEQENSNIAGVSRNNVERPSVMKPTRQEASVKLRNFHQTESKSDCYSEMNENLSDICTESQSEKLSSKSNSSVATENDEDKESYRSVECNADRNENIPHKTDSHIEEMLLHYSVANTSYKAPMDIQISEDIDFDEVASNRHRMDSDEFGKDWKLQALDISLKQISPILSLTDDGEKIPSLTHSILTAEQNFTNADFLNPSDAHCHQESDESTRFIQRHSSECEDLEIPQIQALIQDPTESSEAKLLCDTTQGATTITTVAFSKAYSQHNSFDCDMEVKDILEKAERKENEESGILTPIQDPVQPVPLECFFIPLHANQRGSSTDTGSVGRTQDEFTATPSSSETSK